MIKLKDLLKEQPGTVKQPPKQTTPPHQGGGQEDTSQELKIDIPDSPFEPDASQITSRLKQILVKWKDHVYPDDTSRSHNYYHDIETLVNQIQKHKGDGK